MAISVSVISHAFFSEKGASRACRRYSCQGVSSDNPSDQQVHTKTDNIACECMQCQDVSYMAATSRLQMAGCCPCSEFLVSPRSTVATSPSPRMIVGASPSPRLMATVNSSPRGAGGGKSRRKGHKKRGGRRRGQDGGGESREPKIMQIEESNLENGSREGAQTGDLLSSQIRGSGDNIMLAGSCGVRAVGDVCGVEDAQIGYKCIQGVASSNANVETQHGEVDVMVNKIPSSVDRVTLLKDKSGIVHLGVMVRNSDLNLQSIEELVIHKEKAEQEAKSYCLQVSEKSRDFNNLKLKYEKLTGEVLRLRTMVNRANHLRRESEKATEVLRTEFEKLVKTLFMECSHQSGDKAESANE